MCRIFEKTGFLFSLRFWPTFFYRPKMSARMHSGLVLYELNTRLL